MMNMMLLVALRLLPLVQKYSSSRYSYDQPIFSGVFKASFLNQNYSFMHKVFSFFR